MVRVARSRGATQRPRTVRPAGRSQSRFQLAEGAASIKLDGEGAQLGKKGGLITLLDPEGLKVDGVSYSRDQVRRQGWTIVF